LHALRPWVVYYRYMAGNLARLPLLLVLLGAIGAAQDARFPCQAPAEIRGLTIDQVRSRLRAGQDDFFLYTQLLHLTPSAPKPGALASEFEQKLREHPSDGRVLYLYGRALIGKNTPEAILQLNRAATAMPALPWPYAALAEIYASRNFADDGKLLANVRAYRHLCPANLDGFRHLGKVTDATEAAEWARELRSLLENSKDPEDGRYWRLLWAAEFRVTPQAEYDTLRAKVAADVKRLETLPQTENPMLLVALWDGYKLSGQMDAAERMDRKMNPDRNFMRIYDAWSVKAGMRSRTRMTEEQHQAVMREYAKVSAEWIAKWPDSPFAWSIRLGAMTAGPDWTKEELERVGEQCLKFAAKRPIGWTEVPRELRIAQAWVPHGIRLKDSVKMAEESLDQILLGPEELSDLTAPPNAAEVMHGNQYGFDVSVWDAMGVIVEGAAQLKDFDKARGMLGKMQRWLDENQFKKDDATSGYPRYQSLYLEYAGRLAEAHGHKVDAVALYTRAIATYYVRPDVVKHVRALWDEQGGTQEGWEIATKRLPAPKPPPRPSVGVAREFAAWTKTDKALPEANLQDSLGKTWSVSTLKGKTTFLNVWATWCPPCREELPQIQRLYELSKERGDFQVMTFSVDENPGELEPFLKANGYTFPVILARQYVDRIAAPYMIPQNWIVDSKGMLREESGGFDANIADWAKEMAERTARVAH
jgi:thiol-disulfide isomerase/thioredoxin